MKINNPLCFKTFSRAPSILVERIEFNQDSPIELGLNESAHIEFTLYPSNASNKEVDWSVSPDINGAFEIIQNGNSFTINTSSYEGTYELTVTSVDKGAASASITINIADDAIYATNISISPSSATIKQGESAIFTATVTPSNAVNVNNIQWYTNAPSGAVTLIESTGKTVTVSVSSSAALDRYTLTCRTTSGSPEIATSVSFTIVKASSSEEEIEEHRSTWRGTDLLSSGHFSNIDEIAEAVATGDFSDIWVGDYFTIGGPVFNNSSILSYDEYNLVVMDINTVSSLSQPHLVLMPDHIIGVTELLQPYRYNLYEEEDVSNMLQVYSQTLRIFLGENNLINFTDRMPTETSYSATFPGITLPSVKSLTNSYSNVNPLSMSSVFTSVLPGISLSSSGAGRDTLSALASYQAIAMYAVGDLNNSNGYLITVMNNGQLMSSAQFQNMSLGICPLLVFG